MSDALESTFTDPELAANLPPRTFIEFVGPPSNPSWLAFPDAGNVRIAYEYAGAPAPTVQLRRQDGQLEPVNPGFTTYRVDAGDALTWVLSNPTNAIKLGWAYV